MNHAFEGRMLGVVFLIAFAVPAARAQVSTVELYGLVRDPSANIVPRTPNQSSESGYGLDSHGAYPRGRLLQFLGLKTRSILRLR
jgi:hypothetical protein